MSNVWKTIDCLIERGGNGSLSNNAIFPREILRCKHSFWTIGDSFNIWNEHSSWMLNQCEKTSTENRKFSFSVLLTPNEPK